MGQVEHPGGSAGVQKAIQAQEHLVLHPSFRLGPVGQGLHFIGRIGKPVEDGLITLPDLIDIHGALFQFVAFDIGDHIPGTQRTAIGQQTTDIVHQHGRLVNRHGEGIGCRKRIAGFQFGGIAGQDPDSAAEIAGRLPPTEFDGILQDIEIRGQIEILWNLDADVGQ